MTAPVLRKLEQELNQLAKDAEDHPVEPFDLRVIARRIGAQAELIEGGMAE